MASLDPDLVEAINNYLLVETALEPADLGFVFGTSHGVDLFCQRTAELWHQGYFPHVLISGGVMQGYTMSEAVIMREKLMVLGVPMKAILVEERAANTGENVTLSLPIIEREIGLSQISSIVAIGKFRASRRYLMTLERHWGGVKKMLVPIHYHDLPKERWMEDNDLREGVLSEWQKIVPYLERGFLSEVDLPGVDYRPDTWQGLSS